MKPLLKVFPYPLIALCVSILIATLAACEKREEPKPQEEALQTPPPATSQGDTADQSSGTYTLVFENAEGGAQSMAIRWTAAHKTPTLKSLGLSLPTPPARTEETFVGWITENGESFGLDTIVAANNTLYAQWRQNEESQESLNVSETAPVTTFNQAALLDAPEAAPEMAAPEMAAPAQTATDASAASAQTAAPDVSTAQTAPEMAAPEVAAPEQTALTEESQGAAASPEEPPPIARGDHTVAFDSSGGNAEANPSSLVLSWTAANRTPSLQSSGLDLPSPPGRTDYTFDGWETNDGEPFTAGTPVAESMTVYAQWRENPPPESGDYTLTFDGSGAEGESQVITLTWTRSGGGSFTLKSQGVDLPAPPVNEGLFFAGWFTAPEGEGTIFTADTSVRRNITLYARWSRVFVALTLEDAQSYLRSQEGTIRNPLRLEASLDFGDISQPNGLWRSLLSAIAESRDYVNLDISRCLMAGTIFNNNNYPAIRGMEYIREIRLPNGVTAIGENAFFNCANLTYITLPSRLTVIGPYAFFNCTSLSLTSLPARIAEIGESAFSNCTNLALTSLPAGLTAIYSAAFYSCARLALTSLPDSVTVIHAYAFRVCASLAITKLPEKLTGIGAGAFDRCSSLTSISLPENLASIGAYAFNDCGSLATVTSYAKNPPTLGGSAFGNAAPNLQIKIPVGSIAAYANAYDWSEFTNRISENW